MMSNPMIGPRLQLLADLMCDPDLMTAEQLLMTLDLMSTLKDICEDALVQRSAVGDNDEMTYEKEPEINPNR